jgi:hypothetical protein
LFPAIYPLNSISKRNFLRRYLFIFFSDKERGLEPSPSLCAERINVLHSPSSKKLNIWHT